MPELIEDGKTGILVEDFIEGYHRIAECFSMDRKYIAQRSRSLFSYQKMTTSYISVYNKILKLSCQRPGGCQKRQITLYKILKFSQNTSVTRAVTNSCIRARFFYTSHRGKSMVICNGTRVGIDQYYVYPPEFSPKIWRAKLASINIQPAEISKKFLRTRRKLNGRF